MAEESKGIKVPDLDNPKEMQQEKPAAALTSIKAKIQENLKEKKPGEKHGLFLSGTIPVDKPDAKKDKKIRPAVEKVLTGIEGMDKVMGGGFEEGSVNIVGGGPGSGKSILATQFLVNGVTKYKEAGIYITFEETRGKLIKHMKGFGWDLEELEKDGMLTVLEYSPSQVNKILEEGGGIIDSIIEKSKAKRIVIDSLTAFTLLFRDDLSKIEASIKLFNLIQTWGCTALLTAESDPNPEKHKSTMIEFEVDGVILLYNLRKEDTRERALEILKLRGIHHSTKIFPRIWNIPPANRD